MPDIEITLRVVRLIASIFGPFVGAILALFVMVTVSVAYLLGIFAQKRIEALAQEISSKSVSAFQKNLDLLFRDEFLRNNVRLYLAQRSVDAKLQLYNRVYALYFKYQESWFFTNDTPNDTINTLWEDIIATRHEVFLNTIYLGPLADPLLQAVIGMLNGLREKKTNLATERTSSDTQTEIKIMQSILDASQWLVKNMATHQDATMYDLSADMERIMKAQRDKFLEEHAQK